MEKCIKVSNKAHRKLREVFKKSKVTVWNALTYKTNSNLAQRIRELAIKMGGVIVEYDESEQDFTNLSK